MYLSGVIYFTEASNTSYLYEFVKVYLEDKHNGRLLKYTIATGETTTLLRYFYNNSFFPP